jgi:hypothetical protein
MEPRPFFRISGAGENKQAFLFPVINLAPDIVSNLGILLPFINEAGNLPFKDQTRINIHADPYAAVNIHPGHAFSYPQGGFRLAASLGALYQDSAGTFKPVFQVRVGKAFKIGTHTVSSIKIHLEKCHYSIRKFMTNIFGKI